MWKMRITRCKKIISKIYLKANLEKEPVDVFQPEVSVINSQQTYCLKLI